MKSDKDTIIFERDNLVGKLDNLKYHQRCCRDYEDFHSFDEEIDDLCDKINRLNKRLKRRGVNVK